MSEIESHKDDGVEEQGAIKELHYGSITSGYQAALQVVDDVVLKNYISKLSSMPVVPLSSDILEKNIRDNVRLFKITEMVYEQEEFATYKFASVFNSLVTTESALFIIIDSNGIKTDFYMGIRSLDPDRTTSSIKDTVKNAMKGQFPGIKIKDDYTVEEIQEMLAGIKHNSISAVSCVANSRANNIDKNQNFVQGLEKLVLSMQGEKYTGIIIANGTTPTQLKELRRSYENVYTQMSVFASTQVNYNSNKSVNFSFAETKSTNRSFNKTTTQNETEGTTISSGTSHTHGTSKESVAGRTIKGVSKAAAMVGAALAPVTGGASFAIGGVVSGAAGMIGSVISKTVNDSETTSNSISKNIAKSTGISEGITEGESQGNTKTEGYSSGMTEGMTLTLHDKAVEGTLQRIDKQLKRIDEFESLGMYECAAYFLSDNQYSAEVAASTYKALMRGENSGVEIAAINTWGGGKNKDKTAMVAQYVKNFIHPVFRYNNSKAGNIEVTPCSLVSGNELSIHMGLPRKSVCGLPVIEHADFGKEVVVYDSRQQTHGIKLGKIFNMGSIKENDVCLSVESLAMHTFITGSTGAGKSTVIYALLDKLMNTYVRDNSRNIKFMVIEPTKGEYKNRFGYYYNVKVYGTNYKKTPLLRINPFSFPEDIHVLEHIDRLIEIFNVCWPMYAAMPAVLKDSIERAYLVAGWNLDTSECRYHNTNGRPLYPNFIDVLNQINIVMNESQYSSDSKGDYKGALSTRLKSLTNGLYGQIFTSNEIPSKDLFDENVIVDLSRTGSSETKSLIMGLLVMKLQEYRMSTATGSNQSLQHVTVLEEAHNILKRTSTEQNSESSNVLGKSVEMLANSIAEMRTYGEGFIIADQAPGLLDMSVIRNTNTKIILRLPDLSDRELVGKAAGLNDKQIMELSKLKTFVAAVYQNNWIEPVLCNIEPNFKENGKYENTTYQENSVSVANENNLIQYLISPKTKGQLDRRHINELTEVCLGLGISAEAKVDFLKYINSTEKKEVEHLRGAILYEIFNSESAFNMSRTHISDIGSWYVKMREILEPDMELFKEDECQRVIAVLTREKAERDKTPESVELFERLMEFL